MGPPPLLPKGDNSTKDINVQVLFSSEDDCARGLHAGVFKTLYMTISQLFGLLITEMQARAFAVTPVLAVPAFANSGPAAVAHYLVAVLPHVPKVILVDVTLYVVATQARACRDTPVAKH